MKKIDCICIYEYNFKPSTYLLECNRWSKYQMVIMRYAVCQEIWPVLLWSDDITFIPNAKSQAIYGKDATIYYTYFS